MRSTSFPPETYLHLGGLSEGCWKPAPALWEQRDGGHWTQGWLEVPCGSKAKKVSFRLWPCNKLIRSEFQVVLVHGMSLNIYVTVVCHIGTPPICKEWLHLSAYYKAKNICHLCHATMADLSSPANLLQKTRHQTVQEFFHNAVKPGIQSYLPSTFEHFPFSYSFFCMEG